METIAGPVHTETDVRRSRFVVDIVPVADRATAEEEIKNRRLQHPNANHVVYAYLTGEAKSEISGMSDDGEPKGTAGRPIMEILKGSGLTNTLITVVRYFGGTKLGTGGLVRAYGDAARVGLARVVRKRHRTLNEHKIVIPYELHHDVRAVLKNADAEIRDEQFAEQITITVALEGLVEEDVREALQNVSRGTLKNCCQNC